MKKKNSIIVILSVLGLFGIMLFFTYKNNNTVESEWLNYVLGLNIQEITLDRFYDVDYGDKVNKDETITLSKNNLRNIFSELDRLTLKRVYTDVLDETFTYTLSVYYLIDGEGYSFQIYDNAIQVTNDKKLMNLLNDSYEYNDYDEFASDDSTYYYFAFDNFNKKIFAKYFD